LGATVIAYLIPEFDLGRSPQLRGIRATKLSSWKLGRENWLNHQSLILALADFVKIELWVFRSAECENPLPVQFKMAESAQTFNL